MKLVISDFNNETHEAFFDLNEYDGYSFYFIDDKEFERHLTRHNGIKFNVETLKELSLLALDSHNLIDMTVYRENM